MNENQREQVCENAKYLREVRPVDPDEIYEYVEGTPHPAAVRQVLREEAPALALVERDDGRFGPVDDEPVSAEFAGVDALPEDVTVALEDCLLERFGPGWPDGESGALLRGRIRDFKRRYLAGARVTYDHETALGYAIYHLPAYFAAGQYVLVDLVEDGLLPKHLRVLDVGAGVGGPALGLDALVPDDALVEYHAVEPSEAAAVLERLLETTGRNFHSTVHRRPVEKFDPPTALAGDGNSVGFDLVLFANVLSELSDPERVLVDSLEWLTPGGTVAAISPADRNTATALREFERAAERSGATVYAPTVRLWPNETPESESWSFRRHPPLAVPGFQRRLDEGERTGDELAGEGHGSTASRTESAEVSADGTAPEPAGASAGGTGEFVNVDVQYAYSLLRLDSEAAVDVRPARSRVAKLAESERHVTERVDCVAIKLSPDLSEEGNPLYLVGDGSEKLDHFAVLTAESVLNRDLVAAEYGDTLLFENVLVLWNDDEGAYNLVVDSETVVDRIAL